MVKEELGVGLEIKLIGNCFNVDRLYNGDYIINLYRPKGDSS